MKAYFYVQPRHVVADVDGAACVNNSSRGAHHKKHNRMIGMQVNTFLLIGVDGPSMIYWYVYTYW